VQNNKSKFKKIAYLVGPIEGVLDHGRGWREEIAQKLLGLGIGSLDPTKASIEIGDGLDVAFRRQAVEAAREARDWEKVLSIMEKVWEYNEGAVKASDFLAAYFPEKVSGGGTLREMQKAFDYGKPVYLVCGLDPSSINTHILHMVLKRGKIFSTFDELIEFLKKEYGTD